MVRTHQVKSRDISTFLEYLGQYLEGSKQKPREQNRQIQAAVTNDRFLT